MSQEKWIEKGAVDKVARILKVKDYKRIFLLTGKSSYELSGAKAKIESLLQGKDFVRFFDFSQNPKLEDAIVGIKALKQFNPDLIIAIGGGSVIDMAKVINILSANKGDLKFKIKNNEILEKKSCDLVAIPTTAGTGSESTHFAVLYINKTKYSLAKKCLLPEYAIVDSDFVLNLNKDILISSGLDALCQSIESFWAKNANAISRDYALMAMNLLLPTLSKVAINRNDELVGKMCLGSNYAGMAINISKTTAPHALSYALTSYYNIPHGRAVAFFMGKFFIINSSYTDERGNFSLCNKLELSSIMQTIFDIFKVKDGKECSFKWNQLLDELNVHHTFEKYNLDRNECKKTVMQNINLDRLKNNPVELSPEAVNFIFD